MTENEVVFLGFLVNINFFEGMVGVQKQRFASKLYRAENGTKEIGKRGRGAGGLTRMKAIIGAKGEFFKGSGSTEEDNLMTPQQRGETLEFIFSSFDRTQETLDFLEQ